MKQPLPYAVLLQTAERLEQAREVERRGDRERAEALRAEVRETLRRHRERSTKRAK